jgi:hypothetical protein
MSTNLSLRGEAEAGVGAEAAPSWAGAVEGKGRAAASWAGAGKGSWEAAAAASWVGAAVAWAVARGVVLSVPAADANFRNFPQILPHGPAGTAHHVSQVPGTLTAT